MQDEFRTNLSKRKYHVNHELGVVVVGKEHQSSRSCKNKRQRSASEAAASKYTRR